MFFIVNAFADKFSPYTMKNFYTLLHDISFRTRQRRMPCWKAILSITISKELVVLFVICKVISDRRNMDA
jgi:hypothetical protein